MKTPRATLSCPFAGLAALRLLLAVVVLSTTTRAFAAGHDDARCDRCHGAVAATATATVARESCTPCHLKASQAGEPAALFHGDRSQPCTRCHRYHDADTLVTPRGNVSLAALAGVDREHCRTCHQPRARRDRLSPGHEAAAVLYHEHAADLAGQPPSAGCRACHSRTTGVAAWRSAIAGESLVFAEHSSHPCEITVVAGQATVGSWIRPDIDPRLDLPGGRLECVTCHDLTGEGTSLLVQFAQPQDLCLGCHLLKQPAPTTIAAIDLISPKIPN